MEIPSEPKELAKTVLPDVFTIDYVKLFQKKPHENRPGAESPLTLPSP